MTKKASSLTNPPNSNNPKSKIRRSLIKGTGLVLAGSLGSFGGSYSANAKTTTKTDPVPQNLLNQALQIASKSALVIDLVTETAVLNFGLDISVKDVKRRNVVLSALNNDLVGIVLKQIQTPDLRTGANLILNVNLKAEQVESAQFIWATSQIDWLQMRSLIIMQSDGFVSGEVFVEKNKKTVKEWVEYRPRRTEDFIFPRDVFRPIDPRESVETGFAPEFPEYSYFHTLGCSQADWLLLNKQPAFLCTQTSEVDSKDLTKTTTFTLEYSWNKKPKS